MTQYNRQLKNCDIDAMIISAAGLPGDFSRFITHIKLAEEGYHAGIFIRTF